MKMWNGVCTGMTDRAVDLVIADAGPLIHLDELGCLDLLFDFPKVWIPEAVWREVETHRPIALADLPFIRVEAGPLDPRVATLARTLTLHHGEREALTLTARFPDALFLTDDTAARLAAQTFTQRVHGTLGLLVRAIRRVGSAAGIKFLICCAPFQNAPHCISGLRCCMKWSHK